MKRLLYGMLCLALLAGCSKDKGIDEPDEPEKPKIVTLELSDADLIFEAAGGQKTFTITCNADWTITNGSDWCTTDVTSGNGNRTVTVTTQNYNALEDRNMNLTVKAGDLTKVLGVTQKHGDAIVPDKAKFEVAQGGDTLFIKVRSNVTYEVNIPDFCSSWIQLIPETRAEMSATYRFLIGENKKEESRMGYIVFASGSMQDTVRIYQAQKDRLVLTQREFRLPAKDTTLTVELRTNVDYEMSMLGDGASWIHVVETRACRVDRLQFHVGENTAGVSRTAKIAVWDKNGVLSDTLTFRQFDLDNLDGLDITDDFDPEFAKVLEARGYIPDATHITVADVKGIDTLDVNGNNNDYYAGRGLTSLAGIEYFESLTTLYCSYNQLTSLDVSQNIALTYLQCSFNKLTSLDVSTNIVLTVLACHYNELIFLDVSNNTTLINLNCQNNQLTSLDVSKNTKLTYLYCYNNQLASLDISQNPALTYLNCSGNPGDGESLFPVTAWDGYENTLLILSYNWNYDGRMIRISIPNEKTSEDITAEFDPDFARVLQEKGYIPDASHIVLGEVKFLYNLNVNGTNANYNAGKGLTSLKGVEYFESLTTLYCSYNQLTSLDVSKNTKLTYLYCYNNQLASLDISQNTALTYLDCSYNQFTSLDASQNTALKTLRCYKNQLTSLDVSKNTALSHLRCDYNQLTSLDVSRNTALTYLECHDNQLTSFDASGCTALTGLYCWSNQFTSLDVSKNTALENLWCYSNQLTSLDVSKNTALTYLDCRYNQLTFLDVSKNTALTYLDCFGNLGDGKSFFPVTAWDGYENTLRISSYNWNYDGRMIRISIPNEKSSEDITAGFDPDFARVLQEKGYIPDASHIALGEVKSLYGLNVDGTEKDYNAGKGLTSLKGIEYFESLSQLYCRYNQLTFLDVSKNTKLTYLYCNNNQLTSLDVSQNTNLWQLFCYSNKLSSLDVSKNTALTNLYCHYNQLTFLDVSQNTNLWQLYCYSNKLSSLDVSKNTALTYLNCADNQLTFLDVSQNTALTYLDCHYNQLTSLDVSQNTNLWQLFCYSNKLSSLDVSKNTALTYLNCRYNQLTSLDVSKNTKLTYLYCYSNKLSSLDISQNTALTSLYCYNNPGDGESLFPVTAWFDNSSVPENMKFTYEGSSSDGKSWTYGGKTISIDFRKAE